MLFIELGGVLLVDTKKFYDWLAKAEKDIQGAKILYKHGADYGLVCFHCQQAIEKYLKGFLIYKTGMLQDGHNLVKLCKKVSKFNDIFKSYLKDCAFVNTFYIETRYPAEDPLIVAEEDVKECVKIVEKIAKKVNELVERC